MIVSARDPFHVNKKIKYNTHIQVFKQTPNVWIYKLLIPPIKMKILSYLSNPEIEALQIKSARERYDYMNSEIIIFDAELNFTSKIVLFLNIMT